jgi:hypothetical protein
VLGGLTGSTGSVTVWVVLLWLQPPANSEPAATTNNAKSFLLAFMLASLEKSDATVRFRNIHEYQLRCKA